MRSSVILLVTLQSVNCQFVASKQNRNSKTRNTMNTNVGLQALKWPYLGRILSELSDSMCVGFPAGPRSARKLSLLNFHHFRVRKHNNDNCDNDNCALPMYWCTSYIV